MQNPEKEWFGEARVSAAEKTARVIGVFDSVADKYDLMNDLMSGGLHRVWKDRLVREIRPHAGMKCLDVAGGTGDIAFRLWRAMNNQQGTNQQGTVTFTSKSDCPRNAGDTHLKKVHVPSITVLDLNAEMLRVGRDRALDRGLIEGFEWVTGNAEALPLPDAAFDLYTIAFGLRNVTHIDTALAEAVRVLRPGGRFYCLEFSRVQEPFLARIYDAYSFKVLPAMGQLVAKDRASYQYLAESIRKFPAAPALARRMGEAGLVGCRFTALSFGIVTIWQGTKP